MMVLPSSHTPENARTSKIARWEMLQLFRSLEARVSRITDSDTSCGSDTAQQIPELNSM